MLAQTVRGSLQSWAAPAAKRRFKSSAGAAASQVASARAEELERLRRRTSIPRMNSLQDPKTLRRRASMSGFSPSEVIIKKRNGEQLSAEEIDAFVTGFHRGYVADYQMSAFLMAVCTRGMTNQEASDLTMSMVQTGKTANLASIRPNSPKVDKHSSGGIGDKVSLVLAPLVSCFDIVVPMLSGRSLGHTGGTLDKIDSIPGVRTDLSTEEYLKQLETVGCTIVAPNDDFAPVEKAIYTIRDVSGCVEDVALVASSIMAKKLAEKPDALLLDVKVGRGAFARDLNDAAALASMMVSIGEANGIDTCCIISNMNHPLGSAVGNWLEIREALAILSSEPQFAPGASLAALTEVRNLAVSEAAIMLGMAGKARSFSEGYAMASEMLESGEALVKFAEMVKAQGGDPGVVINPTSVRPSEECLVYRAPEDAIIQDIDAYGIGTSAMRLGAGRKYANDPIDHHAGIVLHGKVGEVVRKGDPVFTAYVGDQDVDRLDVLGDPQRRLRDGFERALASVTLAPNRPEFSVTPSPTIEYFVDRFGMTPFKSLNG